MTTTHDRPADVRIDLPSFYDGDFDATFARLRESDPVHWQADTEMWIVTRHADIRTASGDPRAFSTNFGVTVGSHALARTRWDLEGHADASDRPWQLAELRRTMARHSSASPETDNLQAMGPEEHPGVRAVFAKSFTPPTLRALEDNVRALTRGILDDISPGDTGDLVDLLSAPLPIYVIAEILGIPKADRDDFRRWSDVIISAVEPKSDEARRLDAEQMAEMFRYIRTQVEARRTDPRDDLITVMVQAEVDGKPLDPSVIDTLVKIILSAGNETTRSSISLTALALLEHPDQRALLVERPELIPEAVNEMLRWVTPVRAFCRTATVDTRLGDRDIARGDFLAMSYVSANRDPEAWDSPEVFDVTRKVAPGHLTFGHGPHLCLGHHLARLELKVAMQELLATFPDYELAGPPVRTSSTMVAAIEELPVRFR